MGVRDGRRRGQRAERSMGLHAMGKTGAWTRCSGVPVARPTADFATRKAGSAVGIQE